MLLLRHEQLAEMKRPEQERFATRLAQELAGRYPDRFATAVAPETAAFVWRAMDVALRHGLTTERSVAILAQLRVDYGEAFERTPVATHALAMLRNRTLPEPIKIAALQDCLRSATGGRPVRLIPEE